MSIQSGQGNSRQNLRVPTVPHGTAVATFESYLDAVKAVDRLGTHDFPLDQVSILGNDLKIVERVLSRMSYARAAASGVLSGLWFGLFLGVLLMLWGGGSGTSFLFAAVLLGAGFGLISGVLVYALTRRRKDFRSITQVAASNFVIVVDPVHAAQAQRILGTTPTVPVAPVAPAPVSPAPVSPDPAQPAESPAQQPNPPESQNPQQPPHEQ